MADLVEVNRVVVFPWHCDHFGHMNVRWYAHHFDDGAFHLWAVYGVDFKQLMAEGYHNVVAQTKTDFRNETTAGEMLVITAGFTQIGTRSVGIHLRMCDAYSGALCATQDVVEVFFDARTRSSAPIPPELRAKIEPGLVAVPG